jgi:hypothetical protein
MITEARRFEIMMIQSLNEVDPFFVGAASCRDFIVAGSHSHKKNRFMPEAAASAMSPY